MKLPTHDPNGAARGPARWKMRLGLVLGATLLALIAGELGLRAFDPEQAPLRLVQLGNVLANDPRAQFMDLVEGDPELFWRLAPDVRLEQDRRPFYGLISNSQGLREDHEIPATKAQHEVRILFVGDSCTFGYLLRPEETFVQCVEDRLRRDFPGTPIECINAGVPGYSLFQGWRFLETRGPSLQPDLVVLNFGWNEAVSWDGMNDFDSHRRLAARRPPGLLAHSALARKLWSLRRTEQAPASPKPRLTPDEFAGLLVQCQSSARALGAELLVLVGGSRVNLGGNGPRRPFNDYQKRQYQFAESLHLGPADNSGLVDGVQVAIRLARTTPLDEVFLDQTHPSARLNQALGEALVARIAPWLRARGVK